MNEFECGTGMIDEAEPLGLRSGRGSGANPTCTIVGEPPFGFELQNVIRTMSINEP